MSQDPTDDAHAAPSLPGKIEQDTLEVGQAENGGWFCTINNARLLKCTSTIGEMTAWMAERFGPLDRPLEDLTDSNSPKSPGDEPAGRFARFFSASPRRDH